MAVQNLNPQQKSAVEAPATPLLIVAGAGTGKTRTLTSRLLHLMERGVPGNKICAITFTNKAAREMAERVGRKFQVSSFKFQEPFIGTFHSLGARILREEARLLGRDSRFTIFDDDDSFRLVKKILKHSGVAGAENKPAFFLQRLSAVKSGTVRMNQLAASGGPTDGLVPTVFRRYENELKKMNVFDFDDLIEKAVKVLGAHPRIRRKHQRRFPCLLIDEYQDLNNAQYEFVRLLAGDSRNVSVVGDDQQTIYSWRGSNVGIFLNFERDWPGARVVLLEENYRSTATIVAAASALIKNNRLQKPKTLWTRNEAGPPVRIIETEGEDGEARWIGEEISKSQFSISKQSVQSVAVLYRTNAQSRALEQALIERGIPYRLFGGITFYERREIKDVAAALRLALNPKDGVSRERLERTFPKRVWGALRESLTVNRAAPPASLIRCFIEATDYFAYLEKHLPNPDERRENVEELMRFAAQFTELPPFLERLSLLQAADDLSANNRPEQGANRRKRSAVSEARFVVSLMTIHLAKGLEFDRVFLTGCSEGLLPHSRSLFSEAELEEERRLTYVAMTRARQELSLSFSGEPSRFLSELPQELLKFESFVSDEKTLFSDNKERRVFLE